MPYITASIIVQLLRVVIPHFETLYKEGQAGQSHAHAVHALPHHRARRAPVDDAHHGRPQRRAVPGNSASPSARQLITNDAWYAILLMVITMTAGTGLIMWMGELITERGIGNGMSLLIFTSIAATVPELALGDRQPPAASRSSSIVLAIGLVVVAAVVFVEQSQRRIPVQYAKRMVGRRTYGGNNTYIPIKVNMAGVVPVIFASSLLYLPALIAQFNQPRGRRDAAAVGRLGHRTTSPRATTRSTWRCTSCSSSGSPTSTSRSPSTRRRSRTT